MESKDKEGTSVKSEDRFSAIGNTAFLVAGMRYIDYTTTRVCDDMYAGLFAGEKGIEYASKCFKNAPITEKLCLGGNRTRFIDTNVKKYCEKEDIKQILILAAGFDSRPYRMHISSHPTFYQVDTEVVLEYKEEIVEKNGIKALEKLVTIAHDLREPGLREKLEGQGFNSSIKSLVIIEGLFEYVPVDGCVALLKTVGEFTPSGSVFICTTPSRSLYKCKQENFSGMVTVMLEYKADPVGGTDNVEADILKPAGLELLKLIHTSQPEYFHNPDISDPVIKHHFEVDIKKFNETGEGARQQLYVARKI